MHDATETRDLNAAKDGPRIDHFRHVRTWAMFGAGFALGLVVLQIAVAHPLKVEFLRIQRQIGELERGVQKLTGQSEQAAKTSELLGALAEQGRQSRAANDALAGIKDLQAQLIDGERATAAARSSLATVGKLRQEAVKAQAGYGDALAALDKLTNLQQRLIGQYHSVLSAQTALAEFGRLREMAEAEAPHLTEARRSLDSLIELASLALAEQDRAVQAGAIAREWRELNERLIAGADQVGLARDASDELIAIKETVLCGSDQEQPQRAREALDELVEIRERLHGQTENLAAAQAGLDGLLSIKDRILARTADLADAVETLELTSDLHRQLQDSIRQFEGVRRWLVEIVMLEPTVERTMNALKPLADLANLRRLNPAELRHAARAIVGERTARLAEKKPAIESRDGVLPETEATTREALDGIDLD